MKTLTEHHLFGYFAQCMNHAGSVLAEELSLSFTGFTDFLTGFSIQQEISHSEKLRQLCRIQMEISILLRLFMRD